MVNTEEYVSEEPPARAFVISAAMPGSVIVGVGGGAGEGDGDGDGDGLGFACPPLGLDLLEAPGAAPFEAPHLLANRDDGTGARQKPASKSKALVPWSKDDHPESNGSEVPSPIFPIVFILVVICAPSRSRRKPSVRYCRVGRFEKPFSGRFNL